MHSIVTRAHILFLGLWRHLPVSGNTAPGVDLIELFVANLLTPLCKLD